MSPVIAIKGQKNIGDILHYLMASKKISSGSDLARKLAIPPPTINRILSGQVLDPRASTLSLLADYFNVSIDQLIGKTALPKNLPNDPSNHLQPSMAIPVIPTSLTTDIQSTINKVKDWFRWTTDTPSKHKAVFAVKLDHDRLEPYFQSGTLLVVNPNLKPCEHDYIAVHLAGDNMISIKKLR